MSSFVKRPNSEETEDDILQQQEEFLAAKSRSSADIVRLTRPGNKLKSKSAVGSNLAENVVRGNSCELYFFACLSLRVGLCYGLDVIG